MPRVSFMLIILVIPINYFTTSHATDLILGKGGCPSNALKTHTPQCEIAWSAANMAAL